MSINGEEYAIKDYLSYGMFYTVLCEIDPAAADPDATDPEGGEDNPDTGDIAGVIVMIIAIGLIGFGGIYASFKKRRTV